MINTKPIYLTSVKAYDRRNEEYRINVRATNHEEFIQCVFGYPNEKVCCPLFHTAAITPLTIGQLTIPTDEVLRLKKFCS